MCQISHKGKGNYPAYILKSLLINVDQFSLENDQIDHVFFSILCGIPKSQFLLFQLKVQLVVSLLTPNNQPLIPLYYRITDKAGNTSDPTE